jgi:hypothetical protein
MFNDRDESVYHVPHRVGVTASGIVGCHVFKAPDPAKQEKIEGAVAVVKTFDIKKNTQLSEIKDIPSGYLSGNYRDVFPFKVIHL